MGYVLGDGADVEWEEDADDEGNGGKDGGADKEVFGLDRRLHCDGVCRLHWDGVDLSIKNYYKLQPKKILKSIKMRL